MSPLRTGWLLFMLISLSSCVSLATGIANAPTYFTALVKVSSLSYSSASGQKLDIYYQKPVDASALQPIRPVVIFFYGGSWSYGKKEQYRFVAARLVKEGYVVVIPDYVKYPQAKFPDFMQDAARATVWVKQNILKYGGDPQQINIVGHSAGAFIGALLLADDSYLTTAGGSPDMVCAFAGLAGPYDFTPESDDLKAIFGPPERYDLMHVPPFIDGTEPPMLLLHGEEDDTVGSFNQAHLAEAITQKHGVVKTILYPKTDHYSIISTFVAWDNGSTPIVKDMVSFFQSHACQRTESAPN
ncbi:MAG: alpha/beta hydrolase [Rickettsiales bacterium]|nr:alpha/beta hydrolase [Rickettsiales bacterium]